MKKEKKEGMCEQLNIYKHKNVYYFLIIDLIKNCIVKKKSTITFREEEYCRSADM
jgi:hypothetical protein